MYIYKPNPVFLPEEIKTQRELPNSQIIDKTQIVKLDTKTVFYDIFLDRYTRRLNGIGPRLFNLKKEIFPLTIVVNGVHVDFRLNQIDRLVFLESNPLPERLLDTITITLWFKNFKQEIILNWRHDNNQLSRFDQIPLTITTLQKDNQLVWIRDWILWHRRLHDVRRVVLYDNGSADQEMLAACLRLLEPDVQIILVHWPFPHGVMPYKHAQHGSLNHCRLKFSISNSYCVNLDADEYLVNMTNNTLLEYLNRNLKQPKPGAVIFQEFLVPNIVNIQQNRILRCFDFPYRFRQLGYSRDGVVWDSFGRTKYIFQFGNIGYNAAHRTISEKNQSFAKRYNLSQKCIFM